MNLCNGLVVGKASPIFSFFTLNYSKVHTSKNRNNTEKRDLSGIKIDSYFKNFDCVLDSS